MYRLLIVDDEPILVDGIYRLMLDIEELDLEICRAYSGDEALELLHRIRIDVVLTDIRMPGMTGLELHKMIIRHWPDCRVIFLSGYNDFDYIQNALRHGSVDYVLKTEPPEEIVASVRKAVASLIAQRTNKQFVDRAKEQFRLAVPALQREWLLNLCEGAKRLDSLDASLLSDLDIRLRLDENVLLVIGRVDQWMEGMRPSDKALLLYAVHNVAEEFLTSCTLHQVDIDRNRFIWFIQPHLEKGSDGAEASKAPDALWSQKIRFVHGMLEAIQTTCKELLKVPVSLAAAGRAEQWDGLSARYDSLRKLLSRGLGLSEETLLIDEADAQVQCQDQAEMDKQEIRMLVKRLAGAEFLFESGEKEEWLHAMSEISRLFSPYYADKPFFVEMYYALASQLLTQFNKWEKEAGEGSEPELDKLIHFGQHASREDAFDYLSMTAIKLFDMRKHEQDDRTNQVVERINRYIADHLDKDLSLTALSRIVHLNPCYLSRLYKQMTGVGLLETITEVRMSKAKEYVVQSHLKIHEITKQVGFESPAYFARIFKKRTGYTPQEYRSLNQK
jgi:two-component system, response regulator YesN